MDDISENIVEEREIKIFVFLQLRLQQNFLKVLYKKIVLRLGHEYFLLEFVERLLDGHGVHHRVMIEPVDLLEQVLERFLSAHGVAEVVRLFAMLFSEGPETGLPSSLEQGALSHFNELLIRFRCCLTSSLLAVRLYTWALAGQSRGKTCYRGRLSLIVRRPLIALFFGIMFHDETNIICLEMSIHISKFEEWRLFRLEQRF